MMTPVATAFHPLRALSALRAVLRDPEDTAAVFRLLSAISGRAPKALRARLAASRRGAELLVRRPELLPRLRDRAALEALPAGSLGRAYLDFLDQGHLTADGLVTASEAGEQRGDAIDAWLADRLRDSHDLWHVVLGYRGDLVGEASLLGFTFAQTHAPGIGLLVGAALLRATDPDARAMILDGLLRGVRAAWLPAVAWEEQLGRDLEDVRDELRVGAPRPYEPVWSHELAAA